MRQVSIQGRTAEKIVDGGIRAGLAAVFSGAALFGGYAPFTVGMVAAAGNGWRGLCALCGAAVGAFLLLDFSHALRTAAACILLFAANNAFYDIDLYKKSWFVSALTAGVMLCTEFAYVLRAGAAEISLCLLSVALAAAAAYGCRSVLRAELQNAPSGAALVVLLGLLTAVSSAETDSGFAPGRILSMLTVMLLCFGRSRAGAVSAALCIGLCVDLVGGEGGFLHAAAYAFSALAMCLSHRGDRVRGSLWYLGGVLIFSLPLYAEEGVLLLYEGLAAALCFLLLPSRLLQFCREAGVGDGAQPSQNLPLRSAAAALRELCDSTTRSVRGNEENPDIVYDRTAEKVCRSCSLCNSCWEQDYTRTHAALNDATPLLLRSGTADAKSFPSYFADRCIRFPRFLEAVNAELHDYLLRRSYQRRLSEVSRQAAEQYGQLSDLLTSAAGQSRPASTQELLPYQVGVSLRPKRGESVSGDSASVFEANGTLYVILSDGMGSGEPARRESAMAVRLLEKFLQAGIDAAPALKTLNGALTLRAEATDSFTTIDLLALSLQSGEGELYKYGAAPSYVKRGGRVRRINCSALPAGFRQAQPETTRFTLSVGSFLVMVTDGTADAQEDEWLQNLLAGWDGENPQLLVSAILADSAEHCGASDDAGAVVLYLPEAGQAQVREI